MAKRHMGPMAGMVVHGPPYTYYITVFWYILQAHVPGSRKFVVKLFPLEIPDGLRGNPLRDADVSVVPDAGHRDVPGFYRGQDIAVEFCSPHGQDRVGTADSLDQLLLTLEGPLKDANRIREGQCR